MKYEVHPREYTIVGITSVMRKFVSDNFRRLFKYPLSEMINVMRDGQYYHCQVAGERGKLIKAFLQNVNSGQINLEKEFLDFDRLMTEYEKFINQSSNKFSPQTLQKFYNIYYDLLDLAYAASDSAEYLEILDQKKLPAFNKWLIKTRLRAEPIYKYGEVKFIPKYLAWVKKTYRLSPTVKELSCLFYTELSNFLLRGKTLPARNILVERLKLSFVRQYYKDRYQLLSGKAAQKEINKRKLFKEQKLNQNISQLSGVVAYKGKVTGKIRIIKSSSQNSKLKKGEIMVSVMTDPNYLPAMRRARAFITDEGGMLCHAAIVAREMKKPCVIGTKFATKVFKDGDVVEVDANKGIVKLIK